MFISFDCWRYALCDQNTKCQKKNRGRSRFFWILSPFYLSVGRIRTGEGKTGAAGKFSKNFSVVIVAVVIVAVVIIVIVIIIFTVLIVGDTV